MPLDHSKWRVVGHQTLAVSTSVVSLTIDGDKVLGAWIKVKDAAIRWRIDGTDPTASVGHPEEAEAGFLLTDKVEIDGFEAIRRDSTNSELNILYLAPKP